MRYPKTPLALINVAKVSRKLSLLLALLISGCTVDSDSEFAVYRDRLSRTLAVDITEPSPLKAPMPALAAITPVMIPELKIELLDMFAVDECGMRPAKPALGQLIAQRNSSLGKVMDASTQLQYELQLLETMQACLAEPKLTDEIKTQLTPIYVNKQQQLPLRLANFLSQDQTLNQQLQGSHRALTLDSGQGSETVTALKQLISLRALIDANQIAEAASIDINQQLAVLHQGQILADLQHSLRSNLTQMQALNQQLNTWPVDWCQPARQTILEQVLIQVFIGKVQQQLAHQDRIAQEVLPLLETLFANHPYQQEVTRRFTQPKQQLHAQLKQHVRWWQQREQACNSTQTPSA